MTIDPTVPRQDAQAIVTVNRLHEVRRKHGFIQGIAGINPGGSGENLFNSTSDVGFSSSQYDDLEQWQRKGKGSSPIELGSEPQGELASGVGRIFCKRFLKINFILFSSFLSISTLLFLFLLLLCLLGEYVIYQVGLVPSKYYKVLGDKDLDAFWLHTLEALGIIILVAFVKSTRDYVSKLMTVSWRQILCRALHKMYFSRIHYYQLNVLDKIIDNPDQRLTQDIDKFTNIYGEILPKFIVAPFVIGYYSYQAFTKAGWYGPAGCLGFFFIGSIVNRFAMLPIVKYVVEQERREGDFRFIHMLVRVNAESIAFQDGSHREAVKADASLDQLIHTQTRLYFRQYILNICINLFDYLGSILSYLILAIPIFSGTYDSFGQTDLAVIISQNSFVNMYLIFQFSQLVDLSNKIAELIGVTHRISQLLERLGEMNAIWKNLFPFDDEDSCVDYSPFIAYRKSQMPRPQPHGSETQTKVLIPAWELTNVSYSPPFRKDTLVSVLSMTIYVGQSLLINGSSAAGKSSLLRILRGLWPPTQGRVKRLHPPGPEGAFYCPQKPYLAVGTLREQVCFPLQATDDLDQRGTDTLTIIHYLNMLNLKHLLDRVGGIDEPVSWSVYESLSPGEIQRLCFLRVFFHRPVLAILDESTSALPESMEDIIYGECQRLGVTTISVAHRNSVRKFHDKILTLDAAGGWNLIDV